jgi:hypothetical protein
MSIIDDQSVNQTDQSGQSGDELTQVNPSIAEIVRRAQEALKRVSCNFDDWLDIGAAVEAGRTEAMRAAGTNKPRGKRFAKAMAAWLREHALTGVEKGVRSRLLQCLKHRAEITKWRNDPKNAERQRFNHPNRVFDAWKKWKAQQAGFDLEIVKRPTAVAKLKEANIELQERLHRAERELARGGGDLWDKDDRAEDIAEIMLVKLTSSEAERVARAILTKLKAKKAVRPKLAAQGATASADERKGLYAAEEQGRESALAVE